MNLKGQMANVGFNTDKILILVDGERSKALGITRLTNILHSNGLNAYDVSELECDMIWTYYFMINILNLYYFIYK